MKYFKKGNSVYVTQDDESTNRGFINLILEKPFADYVNEKIHFSNHVLSYQDFTSFTLEDGTIKNKTDLPTFKSFALYALKDFFFVAKPTGGGGAGNVTSVNGMTGNVVLSKNDIGLSNVNNTSDADKPISTATQAELNTKEPLLPTGTATQYIAGDKTLKSINTLPLSLSQKVELNKIDNVNYYINSLIGDDTAGGGNGSKIFRYQTFNKLLQVLGINPRPIVFVETDVDEIIDFQISGSIDAMVIIGNASGTSLGGCKFTKQIIIDPNIKIVEFRNIHFQFSNALFRSQVSHNGKASFISSACQFISFVDCFFDYEDGFSPSQTLDINGNIVPVDSYLQQSPNNSVISLSGCRLISEQKLDYAINLLPQVNPSDAGILLIFPLLNSPSNLFNGNHDNIWNIIKEVNYSYADQSVIQNFASGYSVALNGANSTKAGVMSSGDYLKLLYSNAIIDVGNTNYGTYEEYFVNNFFNIPVYVQNLTCYASLPSQTLRLPNFETDPQKTSADHDGDLITIANNNASENSITIITGTSRKIKLANGSLVTSVPYVVGQKDTFRWNDFTKQWEIE